MRVEMGVSRHNSARRLLAHPFYFVDEKGQQHTATATEGLTERHPMELHTPEVFILYAVYESTDARATKT